MTTPLTDQQLADMIAQSIRREDRDNWGNDLGTGEGFSAERTVATVLADAALKAVKPELDRLRAELADTAMMRDFNQRSAGHIAAKRDLAEAAIAAWDRDEISGDAAVLMIRKALADGPTEEQHAPVPR